MTPDLGQYVDVDYIADGYAVTERPVAFKTASARVDLRGATGRRGKVQVLQPEEYSTGWARFGYAPGAVVHTLDLEYPRLFTSERDALEAFFLAVNGMAGEFTFFDAVPCLEFPGCRFAASEFANDEIFYYLHKATIGLWSLSPFFPLPAGTPVPTLADADAIITRLAYPGSRRLAKKQLRRITSSKRVFTYTKSAIDRYSHTVSLPRRTAAEMALLVSFLISACAGIRKTFPWTFDVARTVRFASSGMEWQRSPVRTDLYDVQLTLEEDA